MQPPRNQSVAESLRFAEPITRPFDFGETKGGFISGVKQQVRWLYTRLTKDTFEFVLARFKETFENLVLPAMILEGVLLDKRQPTIPMEDVDRSEPFGKVVFRLRLRKAKVVTVKKLRIEPGPLASQR
jgi:hypothetical protein